MSISKTTFTILDNYPINFLSDNLSENQITSLFKKVHLKSEDIGDESSSRIFKKSIEYRPVRFLIALFNKKRAIRIMNVVLEKYKTEKQKQLSASFGNNSLSEEHKEKLTQLAKSLPTERFVKQNSTPSLVEDIQTRSIEQESEEPPQESRDLGQELEEPPLENQILNSLETFEQPVEQEPEPQESRDLTSSEKFEQSLEQELEEQPQESRDLTSSEKFEQSFEQSLEQELEEQPQESRDLGKEPEGHFQNGQDLTSSSKSFEQSIAEEAFQESSVGQSSPDLIERKDENPAEEVEEPLEEVVEQKLITESPLDERRSAPPLQPTYRYVQTLPTYLSTSANFIRYLMTSQYRGKIAYRLSSLIAEYLTTSKQKRNELKKTYKMMIDSWMKVARSEFDGIVVSRNTFAVFSEFPSLEQYKNLLPLIPAVIASYKQFKTKNCADKGIGQLNLNSKHLIALLNKKKVKEASDVEIQIANLLLPIADDVMLAINKGLKTKESRDRAVAAWKETADRWRNPFYTGLFAVAKMGIIEKPIKYFLKSSLPKYQTKAEEWQERLGQLSNELAEATKAINNLIHKQQKKLTSLKNEDERKEQIKSIEELKKKKAQLSQDFEEEQRVILKSLESEKTARSDLIDEQIDDVLRQLLCTWIDKHKISKLIECLQVYRQFSIQISDISANFNTFNEKERKEKIEEIRQLIVQFLVYAVEGVHQYSKEIAKDDVESRIFTALDQHIVNLTYPENTTNFFHTTWDKLFVPLLEDILSVPNFFQTVPRLLDETKEKADEGDLNARFKLGKKYYKRGSHQLIIAEDILGDLADKHHYTKAQNAIADLCFILGSRYASYVYLTYSIRDKDLPQEDKEEEFERGMQRLRDGLNDFRMADEYLKPLEDHPTLGEKAIDIRNCFHLKYRDWNENIRDLIINANNGNAIAMCDLGIELLKMASTATRKDFVQRKGLTLLEKAANANPPIPKALHALGMFYIYQKNFRIVGGEHLKRAAKLGFAQAKVDLEEFEARNK